MMRFKREFLAAVLAAAALFLFAASSEDEPAPDAGEEREVELSEADRLYLQGVRAFQEGRDQEAARALTESARLDGRCLSLIEGRSDSLPERPCSQVAGVEKPHKGDPAARILYRLAVISKGQAPEEAASRHAGWDLLERIIRSHQGSPWEDDAALLVLEDRFCLDRGGWPACIEWEIRLYEQWLSAYPFSDHKPKVMRSLAERYLMLARMYEKDEPWSSPVIAELSRGQAWWIANRLDKNQPGAKYESWAGGFKQKIKETGKPYSITPVHALPEEMR